MISHGLEGRELANGTREVGGYEVPAAMRGESTMEKKKSARGVGSHGLGTECWKDISGKCKAIATSKAGSSTILYGSSQGLTSVAHGDW
jgi:hypothetical protein